MSIDTQLLGLFVAYRMQYGNQVITVVLNGVFYCTLPTHYEREANPLVCLLSDRIFVVFSANRAYWKALSPVYY